MADIYGTMISLLDRIAGSYPTGIASRSLQTRAVLLQEQPQKVSCIMVIGGESEERRASAVEFARSVCEKGLELRSEEYRILCEEGVVEKLDAYIEQCPAKITVIFQGSAEVISTKNVGAVTMVLAPSALQVMASPNLKRMLWSTLRAFRRSG